MRKSRLVYFCIASLTCLHVSGCGDIDSEAPAYDMASENGDTDAVSLTHSTTANFVIGTTITNNTGHPLYIAPTVTVHALPSHDAGSEPGKTHMQYYFEVTQQPYINR